MTAPCTCNRCPTCGGLLPVPYYVPVPMPVWPWPTPYPTYPLGPVWAGTPPDTTTTGSTITAPAWAGVTVRSTPAGVP